VENNSIRQKEEKLSVGKSDEQSVPVPWVKYLGLEICV
jgi:hypothetical protein